MLLRTALTIITAFCTLIAILVLAATTSPAKPVASAPYIGPFQYTCPDHSGADRGPR